MFQGLSLQYPYDRYGLVIPGSEIPEWFTHQSMGDEANIKEPSNLCNEWMGIAVCVVFRSHPNHQIDKRLYLDLTTKGNEELFGPTYGDRKSTRLNSSHI